MAVSRIHQLLAVGALAIALSGCVSTADQSASVSAPTVPAPITAQALVGATPVTLRADFGAPSLQRIEGPAQVWLYQSPVCGLNVILFAGQDGVPHVAQALPNGDPVRCMQSLQQRGLTAAALDTQAAS